MTTKYHAIYGPPGTGKSTKLVGLVADLAKTHSNMAVISFTRAAAGVLTSRIPNRAIRFIGTLHALAFRSLGLTKAQVADSEKFTKWYGTDMEEMNASMSVYQYSYHTGCDLPAAYAAINPTVPFIRVEHLVLSYINWVETYQYITFDQMIEMSTGNIEPFDVIVCDEAQDFTNKQWDMVLSMLNPNGKLIMAGDDDQAVYTWSGANPHAMSELADSSEVLNQSHRIPASVHHFAENIVHRIKNRTEKEYKPRSEEGLVETASYYEPMWYDKHTVLCRDKWVMAEVEEQIIERAIPYSCNSHTSIFNRGRANLIRAILLEDYQGVKRGSRYLYPKYREDAAGAISAGWQKAVDLGNYQPEVRYLSLVDHLAEPRIVLSTIHGFKGEEDDHVVLMAQCSGKVDDAMDNPEAADNEYRVWYVGITRPRHKLTIVGWNQYIQ